MSERPTQAGVNTLTDYGLKTNTLLTKNCTLLHQYFQQKDIHPDNLAYLIFLLESNIEVNKKDDNHSTALFYAL